MSEKQTQPSLSGSSSSLASTSTMVVADEKHDLHDGSSDRSVDLEANRSIDLTEDELPSNVDNNRTNFLSLHPVKSTASRKSAVFANNLTKTLSRIRTSDTLNPGPPPDGGFTAWSQAVLTHLVIFNTWGFINSFGLFQTYYVSETGLNIGSDSAVAWIGSIQVFILFFIGTFSGRALDGGFFKATFILGSIIYLFGMFMLSLCTQYWQVFLAQGICVGIGFGLVFVPSIALTSTYFLHKRSMALGVAVCGSATGGLIFPAIAESLLPTLGFAWTVRIMAFVQMFGVVVCSIWMKPRLPPRKAGPLVEWSAFKEAPYSLYLASGFFFFWSVYIGFFYVGTFGRTILGTSQTTSINLLLTMNGVGIIGRLIPNYIAGRIGPINMITPIVFSTGLIGYCWLAVDSVLGLWIFAIFYGIFAAGIQGLFPVVLTSLTSDPMKVGVRTGMGFGVVGFAVLTGPPIAGALIEQMNGRFLGVQVFAGTSMMVSAVFLILTRYARLGRKWTLKVKV